MKKTGSFLQQPNTNSWQGKAENQVPEEIIHTGVEQWINTGHSVRCEYDPGPTRSKTSPPCALSPGFVRVLSPALLVLKVSYYINGLRGRFTSVLCSARALSIASLHEICYSSLFI